jgi:hypothetical protein
MVCVWLAFALNAMTDNYLRSAGSWEARNLLSGAHKRARGDGGPLTRHRAKTDENDASIRVLKIMPTIAEYWDGAGAVASTVEMTKAALTGANLRCVRTKSAAILGD